MNNEILLSEEVETALACILPTCKHEVNIITGFCKATTLHYIDSLICPNVKKRLLVRFLPSDIASGATDKEIYFYCKENGWELFIDHTIHAKIYIFDNEKCILGSANLTNRGIGNSIDPNKEASACFNLDGDSLNKILTLYKDSIELDDDLYNYTIQHMSDDEIIVYKRNKYKEEKIDCLFAEDFPTNDINSYELYKLRSYKWLVAFLRTKDNNSAYFGEIAQNLHSVFVKDPRPFRKEIKQHLSDLLSAIKRLNIHEISITRPNYSELVELKI